MSNKTLQEFKSEISEFLPADTKDIAYKIKNRSAKAFLRQELPNLTGDLKEAIQALVGTGTGSRSPIARTNPKVVCIHTIVDRISMTDLECFKEFKKGPAEMRDLMKYAIRDVPAENRAWITFDGETYSVEATGAEAPEGWTGYIPYEEDEI